MAFQICHRCHWNELNGIAGRIQSWKKNVNPFSMIVNERTATNNREHDHDQDQQLLAKMVKINKNRFTPLANYPSKRCLNAFSLCEFLLLNYALLIFLLCQSEMLSNRCIGMLFAWIKMKYTYFEVTQNVIEKEYQNLVWTVQWLWISTNRWNLGAQQHGTQPNRLVLTEITKLDAIDFVSWQ